MANEFKHKTVGTQLTQAEFESVGGHEIDSQAIGDILYASSTTQIIRLGIGSSNAVLTVSGGVPAWTLTPTVTTLDATTDVTIGDTVITDGVITDSTGISLAGNVTVTGNLLPAADDTYDLGSTSAAWQDLFLEGNLTLTDAGTIGTAAGALTIESGGALGIGRSAVTRGWATLGKGYTGDGTSSKAHMLNITEGITGASGDTTQIVGVLINCNSVTQTATESIANIAQVMITEPGITDNLTGDITRAATLLIDGIPTEGETDYGLMIDGAAADGFYIGLASSDVATGLSSAGPGPTVATDDFFTVSKMSATQGGVLMQAMSEGDGGSNQTFFLDAIGGTAITTDVVGSAGQVNISVGEHDQANGLVDMAAAANILSVGEIQHTDGARLCRLLLKANGVLHLTNATPVALDAEDDVQLVRAMQLEGSDGTGIIESEYDNPFYSHERLLALGLAGEKNEEGVFLFPLQRRLHAHEGAMWQTYIRVRELESKLALAEQKLAAIGA